jgi:serine/threonine protein kinase
VIDTICPACDAIAGTGRFCLSCGIELAAAGAIGQTPPSTLAVSVLAVGALVADRYRVQTVLAAGSMGTVYRVRDEAVEGTLRALKELQVAAVPPEDRAELEQWFVREGETLRTLQHAAIPHVYAGFTDQGRRFLLMDLVEGHTLEDILHDAGGRLTEAFVLRCADQVLDVLSYLHSLPQPIIFRDLKPSNLMLTPEGAIRVIDFGLARPFSRRTAGTAIGTPGYAPPEQYQGLAEPASDLYALGATIHHLLTGRDPRQHPPFQFPPVRSLAPEVSAVVAAVVDRALVLDPRRRFDTPADMYRALHPDVPLEMLPKLTVERPTTAVTHQAAPTPSDLPSLTVLIGPVPRPPGKNVAALAGDERWLTFGGVSLYLAPDWRSLALHNHTEQAMHCELVSSIGWLQPEPSGAVLAPHGMVEIALLWPRDQAPAPLVGEGSPPLPGSGAVPALPVLPARGDALDQPAFSSVASMLSSLGPSVYLRVDSIDAVSMPARRLSSALPGLLPVSVLGALSFVATFIVVLFHLSLAHLYLFELPALLIAIILQRRARR